MMVTWRLWSAGWRSPAIAVAWATPEMSMETSAGPMSARIAPAACARSTSSVTVAVERGAQRLGGGGQVEALGHLLGERAVVGLELGERQEERAERLPGIVLQQGGLRVADEHLVLGLEHGLDERFLGGEVPAHSADAHAGPPGDLLHLGPQAALGEDLRRRLEHPLPVAARSRAHRPRGDVCHERGRQSECTFRMLVRTGRDLPF